MNETDAEPNGNGTIVCESCGHLNFVDFQLSVELQPLIRCSECCHPQPPYQTHMRFPAMRSQPAMGKVPSRSKGWACVVWRIFRGGQEPWDDLGK